MELVLTRVIVPVLEALFDKIHVGRRIPEIGCHSGLVEPTTFVKHRRELRPACRDRKHCLPLPSFVTYRHVQLCTGTFSGSLRSLHLADRAWTRSQRLTVHEESTTETEHNTVT